MEVPKKNRSSLKYLGELCISEKVHIIETRMILQGDLPPAKLVMSRDI